MSLPRSAFAPVLNARHHLLVAGGIGVTPILSHVRAALEWGRSFEVIYSFRDQSGAHADELAALCGDRMITVSTPGELRTASSRSWRTSHSVPTSTRAVPRR